MLLRYVAHGRTRGVAALSVRKAARTGRDRDARCQALDIPLEGPGKRLVEVVEIEDEFPVGRVIPTKIAQVCVAAEFDPEVRSGSAGEIAGHDRGGAAQEGERGTTHSSIPEGDEVGQAGLLLCGEDLERIDSALASRGLGMRLQGNRFPPRPPGVIPRGGRAPEISKLVQCASSTAGVRRAIGRPLREPYWCE